MQTAMHSAQEHAVKSNPLLNSVKQTVLHLSLPRFQAIYHAWYGTLIVTVAEQYQLLVNKVGVVHRLRILFVQVLFWQPEFTSTLCVFHPACEPLFTLLCTLLAEGLTDKYWKLHIDKLQ
jgi:hypothetical protein